MKFSRFFQNFVIFWFTKKCNFISPEIFDFCIILGMLPYRDDFTPEALDKAELILVQKPEDLPENMQELVADIFHRQFHERHRKRKLIREYKLVDR